MWGRSSSGAPPAPDELLAAEGPNCTGELVTRPIRPAALLGTTPASTERVRSPVDLDAHRAMLAGRSNAIRRP